MYAAIQAEVAQTPLATALIEGGGVEVESIRWGGYGRIVFRLSSSGLPHDQQVAVVFYQRHKGKMCKPMYTRIHIPRDGMTFEFIPPNDRNLVYLQLDRVRLKFSLPPRS